MLTIRVVLEVRLDEDGLDDSVSTTEQIKDAVGESLRELTGDDDMVDGTFNEHGLPGPDSIEIIRITRKAKS